MVKAKKKLGLLGGLGFLGFFYFYNHKVLFLLFFMFFSFFSFFILSKFDGTIQDECFLADQHKAAYWSQKIGGGASIVLIILLTDTLKINDFELKYTLLVGGLSVIFSIAWIIYAVLLNSYEKEI